MTTIALYAIAGTLIAAAYVAMLVVALWLVVESHGILRRARLGGSR